MNPDTLFNGMYEISSRNNNPVSARKYIINSKENMVFIILVHKN